MGGRTARARRWRGGARCRLVRAERSRRAHTAGLHDPVARPGAAGVLPRIRRRGIPRGRCGAPRTQAATRLASREPFRAAGDGDRWRHRCARRAAGHRRAIRRAQLLWPAALRSRGLQPHARPRLGRLGQGAARPHGPRIRAVRRAQRAVQRAARRAGASGKLGSPAARGGGDARRPSQLLSRGRDRRNAARARRGDGRASERPAVGSRRVAGD